MAATLQLPPAKMRRSNFLWPDEIVNVMSGEESRLSERIRSSDPSLQRLVLKDARTVLSNFPEFVNALKGNTTVTAVLIDGSVVHETSEGQLCELLEALGGLRSLVHVEVAVSSLRVPKKVRSRAVTSLLSSSRKLTTLLLWPYLLLEDEDSINLLAESLRDHPSLMHLAFMNVLLASERGIWIRSSFGGESGPGISIDPILSSLAAVPNLRNLQISGAFLNFTRSQVQIEPVQHVATLRQLFEQAQNLESIALRNLRLTDSHVGTITQALCGPQSRLKILDLRFNGIGHEGHVLLSHTLRDNYRLEYVEVEMEDRKEMDFWLTVNRAGRRLLLKETLATRAQCVNVLVNAMHDLDALFYLIRCSPSLCEVSGTSC